MMNTNVVKIENMGLLVDDDTRSVRVVEQIKIKIVNAVEVVDQSSSENLGDIVTPPPVKQLGEAKDLQGRNNGSGQCSGARDIYCTVALDQEEISRTPTIERTLAPFFAEEYQFEIPRRFRYLSIYVWDRDKHTKQDKPIGKIAIKREELHLYNHRDHWFPLRPVDADSEVQGMINFGVDIFDSSNGGNLKRKSNFDETIPMSTTTSTTASAYTTMSTFDIRDGSVKTLPSTTSSTNYFHHFNNHHLNRNQYNHHNYNIHQHQQQQQQSSPSQSSPHPIQLHTLKKSRSFFGRNTTDLSAWQNQQQNHHHHHQQQSQHQQQQQQHQSKGLSNMLDLFHENEMHSYVSVNILGCSDLSKKNGNCDPYVIVTATYRNKKKIRKRTKIRKKTINPEFNEKITFDLVIYDNNNSSSNMNNGSNGNHHHHLNFNHHNHHNHNHHSGSGIIGNNTYTVAPLEGVDLCEICVSVWHDVGIGDNIFLGEIKLPMNGKLQQQSVIKSNSWYFLQPRSSTTTLITNTSNDLTSMIIATAQPLPPPPQRSCATPPGTRLSSNLRDTTLGSMRLQLVYTSDYVFPLANYDDLLNLLLLKKNQPITSSAVYILGELISNKTELAKPLVRIFTIKNSISPIIKSLADYEISNLTDSTTIFRGNTLVSKMMDESMRLSGLHYLHSTLRPIVELILHEKKPCEIDPMRVRDQTVVQTNLINLKEYVEKVFVAIMNSAEHCPQVLCQIFHDLRECAGKYFPANREVRYSVVSGFIFLRFFAPAILGPKLFDLTSEPLDLQTNRTLTLISKTIQSLGNLVSSRSSQQLCKEVYTSQLYSYFCTDKHKEAVKQFLENISTVNKHDNTDFVGDSDGNILHSTSINNSENIVTESPTVILKEGYMTKRSVERRRFGRNNSKLRYFRLTTRSLSYAKQKGKNSICDMPLTEILAVEPLLSETNFKMQNVFKISIQKDRTLFVQATNCVEENEWVDLLQKICRINSAKFENIHLRAYINGLWTCCQQIDQDAKGCCYVQPNPIDIQLVNTLDLARDLQRLNSLIIKELQKTSTASFDDDYVTHFCNDVESQTTLINLTKASQRLDQLYRSYQSNLMKELQYGSYQKPIGDDNYVQMSNFS